MSEVQPLILKYLTENANITVFVQDIANDLGLTKKQVDNALYNLRLKDSLDIETLGQGAVVYHGLAKKDGFVTLDSDARVLALLETGVLLNIEGKLYVAYELELPG